MKKYLIIFLTVICFFTFAVKCNDERSIKSFNNTTTEIKLNYINHNISDMGLLLDDDGDVGEGIARLLGSLFNIFWDFMEWLNDHGDEILSAIATVLHLVSGEYEGCTDSCISSSGFSMGDIKTSSSENTATLLSKYNNSSLKVDYNQTNSTKVEYLNTGANYVDINGVKWVCPTSGETCKNGTDKCNAYCRKELNNNVTTQKTPSGQPDCYTTSLSYISKISEKTGLFSTGSYTKINLGFFSSSAAPLIKKNIDAGYPVMVKLHWSAYGSESDHWVVVVGYSREGTQMCDFKIVDPWPRAGSDVSEDSTLNYCRLDHHCNNTENLRNYNDSNYDYKYADYIYAIITS